MQVHRLVLVDSKDVVQGIVSLSDLLQALILNPEGIHAFHSRLPGHMFNTCSVINTCSGFSACSVYTLVYIQDQFRYKHSLILIQCFEESLISDLL